MTYAYFAIGYGQSGCMPDSEFGSFAVDKRGDLTRALNDAIEFYELPKSLRSQISIKRMWAQAVKHGLSIVSLELTTPTMNGCLLIMGLTEEEYNERQEEE